jgi:hypothetical protein
MYIDSEYRLLFELDGDVDNDDLEENDRCFWETQHQGLEVFN